MTTLTKHGRQTKLWAVVDANFTDAIAGTFTVKLPPNALLTEVTTDTTTAYNSATSAALTVTDGTITFVNAVDVKTTGRETTSNVSAFYPSGGSLVGTFTFVGAPTAGQVYISVGYLVVGRATEVESI